MDRVKVKICCISSAEEAMLAVDYGADAIGLVGQMPSGPGVISIPLIQEISRLVPPQVSTFYLTSETSAATITASHKIVKTSTIQIVDKLDDNEFELLRSSLPQVELVQVIHVVDDRSIKEAIQASNYADAILLDSGNPNAKIKELGGTGRVHNWEISRAIRESITIPLYLAGGLNASNVSDAIKAVEPYGVDVCSGVRGNGSLDSYKLKAFFDAIENC